nr:MAG TPA: hypothetical protein [Caudoviricetes sp.]
MSSSKFISSLIFSISILLLITLDYHQSNHF